MSDYTTVTKTSAIREGRGKRLQLMGDESLFSMKVANSVQWTTPARMRWDLWVGVESETESLCVLSMVMHTIQKRENAKPTHAFG